MTQPPPGIRTAPPRGGPLASVLDQQGSTPSGLTRDMGTLLNQARSSPASIPSQIRARLPQATREADLRTIAAQTTANENAWQPGMHTLSTTTFAPVSQGTRDLIDRVKSNPGSADPLVRQELMNMGYLAYSQSHIHQLLGIGPTGYFSGSSDPQGQKADQTRIQTGGGLLPHFSESGLLPAPLARFANDAIQTTASIVPGGIQLGKGVVDLAVHQNPKPLEQQAKNLADFATSPSQWAQHPANAALLFGGLGMGAISRAGAIGRAATAASTAEGTAGTVGRFLDTTREPLMAGGVPIARDYHENPLVIAAQRAGEALQRRRGVDPNIATGNAARRALVGGNRAATIATPHLGMPIAGLVRTGSFDLHNAGWEVMRRQAGADAHRLAADVHPGGKEGSGLAPNLVRLAAQGSLRGPATLVGDLQRKLGQWRAAEKGLAGEHLAVNRANQQNILDALNNPRLLANSQPLFDAADRYVAHHNPIDEQRVALGNLSPAQADFGQWSRYALDHMGARVVEGDRHPTYQALRSARGELAKVGTGNATPALLARVTDLQDQVSRLRAAKIIKADGTRYPRLVADGRDLPIHGPGGVVEHAETHMPGRVPAYVSEKPAATKGRPFVPQARGGQRPGSTYHSRSGAAETAGITNHGFDALHSQLYDSMQRVIGNARENTTALRFGHGNYTGATVKAATEKAKADAAKFAATADGQMHHQALGPLMPVTFGPDGVVKAVDPHLSSMEDLAHQAGLEDPRAWHESEGPARVYLMHQALLDRQKDWNSLSTPGQLGRIGQKLTGAFRGASLFTSPRWPVGSAQERLIRLIFAGVSPTNIAGVGRASRAGRIVESELHDIAKGDVRHQATWDARHLADVVHAGGLLGSQMFTDVRRIATDPTRADVLKDPAEMLLSERPGLKQLTRVWQGWKGAVTHAIGAAEHNANRALIGKQALKGQRTIGTDRELFSRLMGTVKESESYLRQWTRTGATDPARAEKILRDHLELAGNWTHQPPTVRKLIQTVSPFGLWWLNSIKLLAKSLPKNHPLVLMATAALAASLGPSGRTEQADLPPWDRGAAAVTIPGAGQQLLDLQHYTPFDVARQPGRTAASMLTFAGGSELYDIVRGIDPLTGGKLKGDIPGAVLSSILSAYAPGERLGNTLLTGKGSAAARALHVLSPFPFHNPPGGSGGGGGSDGPSVKDITGGGGGLSVNDILGK